MDNLLAAVALQQARSDGRTLSGAADDRDRLSRVDSPWDIAHVGGRLVDRTGDVTGVRLALLADVEDLQAVAVALPALAQLGHGHPLDAVDVELLLAPGRHPAREVAGDVPQADRGGEVSRPYGVLVIAADKHDEAVRVWPTTRAWSRTLPHGR